MRELASRTVSELLGRQRIILFFVAFTVELTIFFFAVSAPVPSDRVAELQEQARNLTRYSNSTDSIHLAGIIFSNNIKVALLEMIPVYGTIVFVQVIFETGQVLQVASASQGLPGILVGIALFLFPFAFIELFSYSIAVVSGNMLIISAIRKRLTSEIRNYLAEILAVIFLLILAAFMETLTIMNWVIGLSLWLPVLLCIVLLFIYSSKIHNAFI
jgi:hypothetical protein